MRKGSRNYTRKIEKINDRMTNIEDMDGTGSADADTDGDGLLDGKEVNRYKTNPPLTRTQTATAFWMVKDMDLLVDLEVSVFVNRVRALDSVDVGGSADFYMTVVVNGIAQTLYDGKDNDDIRLGWEFVYNVDDSLLSVSVQFQLWDRDTEYDDLCDIDGTVNGKNLEVSYDLRYSTWTGEEDGSTGSGEDDCEIWFEVYQNDYDNDGLTWWEEITHGTNPTVTAESRCIYNPTDPLSPDFQSVASDARTRINNIGYTTTLEGSTTVAAFIHALETSAILHFCDHGVFKDSNKDGYPDPDGWIGICLDTQNGIYLAPQDVLNAKPDIVCRLIIFEACGSGASIEGDNNDFVEIFDNEQFGPNVFISFRKKINTDIARTFEQNLYDQLGAGESFREAISVASNAINTKYGYNTNDVIVCHNRLMDANGNGDVLDEFYLKPPSYERG